MEQNNRLEILCLNSSTSTTSEKGSGFTIGGFTIGRAQNCLKHTDIHPTHVKETCHGATTSGASEAQQTGRLDVVVDGGTFEHASMHTRGAAYCARTTNTDYKLGYGMSFIRPQISVSKRDKIDDCTATSIGLQKRLVRSATAPLFVPRYQSQNEIKLMTAQQLLLACIAKKTCEICEICNCTSHCVSRNATCYNHIHS